MTDIGEEITAWLEQDIPGEIEHMIQAARVSQRRGAWGDDHIGVLSRTCDWPIGQHVARTTPAQLRALAERHDQAADELRDDADELREYADALEGETPLGAAMLEHFAAMLDEADHRKAVFDREYAIANDEGGVLAWKDVDDATGSALWHARVLRVDDVREAARTGRLFDVKGIGPSRYRQIMAALARDDEGGEA